MTGSQGSEELARELRLRLESAHQMLKEARQRVSDAEDALDAHMDSWADANGEPSA